ncbi:MAG TPA: hypothetical protein VMS76_01860 [Planctomycetota bacterium]|nr:hypothetical protein [Planctomycetota bacterium]
MLAILPRVWDPRSAAEELRDRLLYAINHVPGVDFFASEKIELGWGAADRASAQRELDYSPSSALHADDVTATIMASVYSLPSDFVTPEAAARLLGSIQRASERTLVALVDLPMRERLAGDASLDQVLFLETYGRGYTPWPRDPFTLVGRSDGGAAVLVRPNRQLGREEDNFLGLELVQGIPEWLDARWGGLTWSRAPAPFHNGQVILTPRHAWISLHTLEQRVLELLGLERVPEASFARKEGWLRYLAAARRASAELASLYAREIAFVHPLGEEREGEDLEALIEAIAGGAGFDLDSLVTFLEPPGAHRPSALVGDVSGRGSALLGSMSSDELERFRAGFELAPRSEELRRALLQAQGSPRAAGLARFLDLVADALAARGLEVERLPLFLVPVALLSQRDELEHPDFLVTWNNVVPEVREGVARAEGFESLSSSGDREAREVFERAGYRLDLLPPLIRSIILNGGYRCASQHLRAR